MIDSMIRDLDENLVYQELADIRSAFERLIDKFGYATVEDTMTKVITVLEQFETLVSYKRQARLQLVNAELTLEEEKEAHASQQQASNLRIMELQEQNQRITEENENLKTQIIERIEHSQNVDPNRNVGPPSEDSAEILVKLNDVISVQSKKLNEIREEYEELNLHSSKQSSLILKLKAGLQETVHAQKVLQKRNDRLCNELAAAEAQLAALELEKGAVMDRRGRSDSCTQSDERSWESLEDNKSKDSSEDKDVLSAKKDYKRSATQVIREVLSTYSPKHKRRTNKCACDQSGFKFTVEEMTVLINERNIAKERLATIEEDLAFYRDREDEQDEVTEEGFAILDPPPTPSPQGISHGLMTRTLFKRTVSKNEEASFGGLVTS